MLDCITATRPACAYLQSLRYRESVCQVALIPLQIINLMIPAETVHWTNHTLLDNLCPPNKTISAGACQTMIDHLQNTRQKLSASIAVSVTQLRLKCATNRNGKKHIASQTKWNKQIPRRDTLLTAPSRSFPFLSNRIEKLAFEIAVWQQKLRWTGWPSRTHNNTCSIQTIQVLLWDLFLDATLDFADLEIT